jgi:hypothetical protein
MNARSAPVNTARRSPSWRWSTTIWWRSTKISTSLSRSLIGSSRSAAKVLVTASAE